MESQKGKLLTSRRSSVAEFPICSAINGTASHSFSTNIHFCYGNVPAVSSFLLIVTHQSRHELSQFEAEAHKLGIPACFHPCCVGTCSRMQAIHKHWRFIYGMDRIHPAAPHRRQKTHFTLSTQWQHSLKTTSHPSLQMTPPTHHMHLCALVHSCP